MERAWPVPRDRGAGRMAHRRRRGATVSVAGRMLNHRTHTEPYR